MFATDRDLLVHDPNLFRDVAWVGDRRISGIGNISGTTLTLTSYDNTFEAEGIAAGHIALVDGVPYEVIERLTASTATISRLRASVDDPVLPPAAATAKPVAVYSFATHIAVQHRQILKLLGIEGMITEASITNPEAFRDVEALGALYLIYTLAAGPATAGSAGSFASEKLNRARIIRDWYAEALETTGAKIDVDGDGQPEATRRANVLQLIRS